MPHRLSRPAFFLTWASVVGTVAENKNSLLTHLRVLKPAGYLCSTWFSPRYVHTCTSRPMVKHPIGVARGQRALCCCVAGPARDVWSACVLSNESHLGWQMTRRRDETRWRQQVEEEVINDGHEESQKATIQLIVELTPAIILRNSNKAIVLFFATYLSLVKSST